MTPLSGVSTGAQSRRFQEPCSLTLAQIGESFMLKILLTIPIFGLWFVFPSNSWAGPPDLASADWSVKAPESLAAKPPSDEAIVTFLAKLEGIDPDFSICSSQFADLRRSDNLSLVVSTTDGLLCSSSIFDKVGSGFAWYTFDGDSGAPEIKDLAGDGKLVLVVPTDLTANLGGSHCQAEWPVIYAWTGSNYSDVSSQYKSYYEQQLASLQKEIEVAEEQKERAEQASVAQGAEPSAPAASPIVPKHVLESTVELGPDGMHQSSRLVTLPPLPQPPEAPPPDSSGLDCTKAEAAKIERFLGISRDAGMSDAIKWKNSDDPHDRAFAAWVLADIATPEAISDPQTLRHDPDSEVANAGKYGLEQAMKSPEVHTVDQEPISEASSKPSQ